MADFDEAEIARAIANSIESDKYEKEYRLVIEESKIPEESRHAVSASVSDEVEGDGESSQEWHVIESPESKNNMHAAILKPSYPESSVELFEHVSKGHAVRDNDFIVFKGMDLMYQLQEIKIGDFKSSEP